MPVGSVTLTTGEQIYVAYRPVLFTVTASSSSGEPQPPVVYCDIYFNGIFYKTISKTQFESSDGIEGSYLFDIQDACQEFLQAPISPNGGTAILEVPVAIVSVICSFRSSGFDTDGFIVPDGTPPVQGTDDEDPVAGSGGVDADEIFVFNGTLQHTDNQTLADHFAAYSRLIDDGGWAAGTYPLTHRPLNGYFLCPGDNDYYPILSDQVPDNLRLWYRMPGDTDYTSSDGTAPCIGVSFDGGVPDIPDAEPTVPYNVVIDFVGTGPITFLGSTVHPVWMSIDIVGMSVVLSGTPDNTDSGTGIQVAFTVQNCEGASTATLDQLIDVTTCIAAVIDTSPLPGAEIGQPYTQSRLISAGSPIIAVNVITKPAWMTIAIVGGTTVQFTGTPTTGDDGTAIPVQFTLDNCTSVEYDFTIDVIIPQNFHLSAAFNMSIDLVVGGGGGFPVITPTGVNGDTTGHQVGMSGTYTFTLSGTPPLTVHLDYYKNGGLIGTVTGITGAGTYGLVINATEADTVEIFINL